jgi:hypothetical protein
LGPPRKSSVCSRSMVEKPPIPDPTCTPNRDASSGVTFSPADSMAKSEAATAYWMKGSIFFTSFLGIQFSGSNPLISPAILTENSPVSKRVMGLMPGSPATRASQFPRVPMASADTTPIPVTTTLRFNAPSSRGRADCRILFPHPAQLSGPSAALPTGYPLAWVST